MNHIEEDVRVWDDELPEPTDGKHLVDPITGKKTYHELVIDRDQYYS